VCKLGVHKDGRNLYTLLTAEEVQAQNITKLNTLAAHIDTKYTGFKYNNK